MKVFPAMKMFAIVLLLLTCSLAYGATTYVTTWEGNSGTELFSVDSLTGNATSVGLTETWLSGLTFVGSDLYGWGQNGSLYTINTSTGSASLVGVSGASGTEGAIAYDSVSGKLYSADSSTNQLVELNPSTGAGTVVGGFGSAGGDISGLTFSGGTLYGIDSVDDALVTINTATGSASTVGSLGISIGNGGSSVGGLIFTGSDLLLYDRNGIFSVDSGTGVATSVASFSSNLAGRDIGGVAARSSSSPPAVPVPSALLLGSLGACLVSTLKRCKKS